MKHSLTKSLLAPLVTLMTATAVQAATVEWVSSTEDKRWTPMPAPALAEGEDPPVLFVKPDRTFQTIDGFGGSFNELGWIALGKASKSDQQDVIKALFSDEGCAFTLARIPIGASDFATDFYSLADKEDDYELASFSIERDRKHLLPYIKAAMHVRPELKCWASPWSPPMWMKQPEQYNGGNMRWEPQVLTTYANYFSKWLTAYKAEGVDLYAVLPQNEPNQWQVFPSCVWSGDQLGEFIGKYLGPKLKTDHPDIELWVGFNGDPQNDGDNINNRLISVLENPEADKFLTGIAYQYDSKNQTAVAHELYPGKKMMQSESTCYNGDNTWDHAMQLYAQIKQHIGGGANQYFAWNMILDETGDSTWKWRQNAPITVDSKSGKVTYNGEFHVYKHFSHYVKPGAKRVATSGWWGDRLAFVNPDGSIVLVVGNSSGDDHEIGIQVGGLGTNDTIKVSIPARSFNTFVVKRAAGE